MSTITSGKMTSLRDKLQASEEARLEAIKKADEAEKAEEEAKKVKKVRK